MENFKLQKGIGIIKIMRKFLQEKQLKQLFFTLMKTYIDYGTLAWGGAAKTHLTKIDKSMRKTIRLMMFKEKRHTAKPLYEYLKILLVSLNPKLLKTKFMKKRIIQEHQEVICDKYALVYSSSINNSDQTKLVTTYFRTFAGVSSLAYQGYTTWNAILSLIKQLANTKLFAKKYKKHLLVEISE